MSAGDARAETVDLIAHIESATDQAELDAAIERALAMRTFLPDEAQVQLTLVLDQADRSRK